MGRRSTVGATRSPRKTAALVMRVFRLPPKATDFCRELQARRHSQLRKVSGNCLSMAPEIRRMCPMHSPIVNWMFRRTLQGTELQNGRSRTSCPRCRSDSSHRRCRAYLSTQSRFSSPSQHHLSGLPTSRAIPTSPAVLCVLLACSTLLIPVLWINRCWKSTSACCPRPLHRPRPALAWQTQPSATQPGCLSAHPPSPTCRPGICLVAAAWRIAATQAPWPPACRCRSRPSRRRHASGGARPGRGRLMSAGAGSCSAAWRRPVRMWRRLRPRWHACGRRSQPHCPTWQRCQKPSARRSRRRAPSAWQTWWPTSARRPCSTSHRTRCARAPGEARLGCRRPRGRGHGRAAARRPRSRSPLRRLAVQPGPLLALAVVLALQPSGGHQSVQGLP